MCFRLISLMSLKILLKVIQGSPLWEHLSASQFDFQDKESIALYERIGAKI